MRILILFLACIVAAKAQPAFQVGYIQRDLVGRFVHDPVPTRIYYPAQTRGEAAAIAGDDSVRYPLVVLGRGASIAVDSYRSLVDMLVTNGYIVAVPLTQGGVGFDVTKYGADLAAVAEGFWYQRDDPQWFFYHRTTSRCAIGGHGYGGTAAALGAANESGTAGNDSANVVHFSFAPTITTDVRVLWAVTRYSQPALVIAAGNDCIAPDSLNALRLFNSFGSTCRTHVLIEGASHCQFADVDVTCQTAEAECTLSPTISRDAQHDIVDSMLLPWLDWQLKGRCDGIVRFKAFIDSMRAISAIDRCDDPVIVVSLVPDDVIHVCPGDSVTLSAPPGYASYRWSNGATTRSVVVRPETAISVSASGGAACAMVSRRTIVDALMQAPQLPSRTVLCPEATVLLDAGVPGCSYRWSTGDTTRSIVVSAPGAYRVTVTCSCTLTSNVATVELASVPSIEVDGDLEGCVGAVTTLRAPEAMAQWRWSNGSAASSIVVQDAGVYTLSGTTVDGCVVSDTVRVIRHEPIVPSITQLGDTLESTPAVSYEWLYEGSPLAGGTSRRYVTRTPGAYYVRTVDSNGCVAVSSRLIVAPSRVDETTTPGAIEIDGRTLSLTVPLDRAATLAIRIVDASGRVVQSFQVAGAAPAARVRRDLDGLARGWYLVTVERDATRALTRFVLLR
jgi:hypothetical protein